jgi:hypothetical protein
MFYYPKKYDSPNTKGTHHTKYGLGTKVTVLQEANSDTEAAIVGQKVGFIYLVPSLDPTLPYYLPIGPKPL